MIYLLPNGDTFTVFYDIESVDESVTSRLIPVESLPEGSGVLKMNESGVLYYEPYDESSVDPDNPSEPEVPVTPTPQPETTEQKLERVLEELVIQRKHNEIAQQQNLILLDVNMTIYEELITLQDRLNNA